MSLLEKINKPDDIKKMNLDQLESLAEEIRKVILERANKIGGHIGANLGFIEPTIALHYVFSSPIDKIIFDVSHQCYTHKILTGRKEGFLNPEQYETISGYTNPKESSHDVFQVGHTSTSISLATGLVIARNLKGTKENIIAVIGDGSLTGGQAYEGLNNAAILKSNIIILVNDNEMSIAKSQGGIANHLKQLRDSHGKTECNLFKALGFDYYYVEEGNDIKILIQTLDKVKDTTVPTVVHLHTLKGKGYPFAEQNKEATHSIKPNNDKEKSENATSMLAKFITQRCEKKEPVVAVTAAMPSGCGFTPTFRKKEGIHYIDVGIAEQHAISMISGMAQNGAKPILAIYSSFLQRGYDQLSQDLALNNNPAVIVVLNAGLSSLDATHVGQFDIPMICSIPNLVYLAPANKEEYLAMLNWASNQNQYPVLIRVSSIGKMISCGKPDTTDYSKLNTFKVEEKGEKVAIIGLGSFYYLGKQVENILKKEMGFKATLINPHFMTGIDEELLESLKQHHTIIVTLEDGMLEGGFGEKITRYYGTSDMKVLNFGGRKEFLDREPLDYIYEKNHLKDNLIVEEIKRYL